MTLSYVCNTLVRAGRFVGTPLMTATIKTQATLTLVIEQHEMARAARNIGGKLSHSSPVPQARNVSYGLLEDRRVEKRDSQGHRRDDPTIESWRPVVGPGSELVVGASPFTYLPYHAR